MALFEDGALLASDYQEIGRGHAERLVPMIATLPDKGRAQHIAVNCGPGSFTGVRIGMSAAKALAMAWKAELSGYYCLPLVAAQARASMDQEEPVYVAMNGGHGEFFVQNFSATGDAIDDLLSLPAEEAIRNARARTIAGSGADQLATDHDIITLLPDASQCLLLPETDRNHPVAPVYGRAPDAQPNRAA